VNFDNVVLKIAELMPGMRKANVAGKVIKAFPVRHFERNGKQGSVVNLIIGDETGSVRIVLWDTNHVELVEKNEIKEGDVVEVKNASDRDGELHLSGFSEIKKSNKVIENVKTERPVQEKIISEIVDNDSVRLRGTVVQIFGPRFFSVCPECNKKVTQEADGSVCAEHGKVQAKQKALLNLVVDDGTDVLRSVLFSEQVEKLLSSDDLKVPEKVVDFKEGFLGTEVFLSGNMRKNSFFGNIELIANDVEIVDPVKLVVELGG